MIPHPVSISIRVDVNLSQEIADAWSEALDAELRYIEGDEIDQHEKTLGWMVARLLDRQEDPFALLHAVIAEAERDEDQYDWFGEEIRS